MKTLLLFLSTLLLPFSSFAEETYYVLGKETDEMSYLQLQKNDEAAETFQRAIRNTPKGLPLSPIPKRNECQLNACKQFYEEILKLHKDPKVIKRCYSGGFPAPFCDLMECFTVQKTYFNKLMKPLLDLCTQEHPDDPDYNQHFIEGNESCKNPEDPTNALLLFLDGEPAIESLNQGATLYGDLESEGRVGYCYYSISTLEATRAVCGENSCRLGGLLK